MNFNLNKLAIGIAIVSFSACSSTHKVDEAKQDSNRREETNNKYVNNAIGTENEASWYAEVKFEKGSANLDQDDRSALDDLVKKSLEAGKVDEIKIISWADQEYPSKSRKSLSDAQKKLADNRNQRIKDYFKEAYPSLDVKLYNMAERPNAIQNLLQTSDAKTKKSIERAGFSTDADHRVTYAKKESTALVLSILK